MSRRPLASAVAFLLAAACSRELSDQVPPGSPEDFVRAADILVAAQCELDRAAALHAQSLGVKQADITLTLTVQEVEAVGGGVTLGIPIAGTNVTLTRERTPRGATYREMDIRLTHTFGQAPACPTKEKPKTKDGVTFIEGGLGLAEWIGEASTLARKAQTLPHELNYAMIFEVALASDLSPVFDRPIDDVSGSLASRDTDDREVKHRIAVTALPKPTGQRAATEKTLREAARDFLIRSNS